MALQATRTRQIVAEAGMVYRPVLQEVQSIMLEAVAVLATEDLTRVTVARAVLAEAVQVAQEVVMETRGQMVLAVAAVLRAGRRKKVVMVVMVL